MLAAKPYLKCQKVSQASVTNAVNLINDWYMVYVLHAEMGGIEMSEWIKYDGSDEQIREIKSAKSYLVMGIDIGEECSRFVSGPLVWVDTSDHIDQRIRAQSNLKEQMEASNVTHYLICQPHPYADLIKIWADTGCPVWVRPTKPYEFEISDYENHPTTKLMVDHKGVYLITTAPDWNIPGEYRLTPFND